MKQQKILFLVVIALLPLVLVSCSSIFGGASVSGGWAGTAFHDGIIYVGSRDGRVVAINASSRKQQWQWPETDTSRSLLYTTPIVDGDLVYVGTYSGKVYALSIGDGEDIWVYPREGYVGAIVGSPVIANGTIYISSSDGKVYALNTTNGKREWETDYPLADKLWTSPTVMGDTLYVSTFDGHIYALSAETGELLGWSFESEAGFASSPVIYEDTIYVGSFDNKLYAVKIGDSESLWEFRGGKWFWAAPPVSDGVVYAGCLDGKLYAIDAETGEELWQFESTDSKGKPAPIVSSPVLMDNLLIVTDESGTVYVFDLSAELEDEAVPLKTIPIGADVRSPFCAQDGLVYIRDENNKDNQLHVVDINKGEVSWTFNLTKKGE